jgi:hypothetical protein
MGKFRNRGLFCFLSLLFRSVPKDYPAHALIYNNFVQLYVWVVRHLLL